MGDSVDEPGADSKTAASGTASAARAWTRVDVVGDGKAVRVAVGGEVDQASARVLVDGLDEGVQRAAEAGVRLVVVDLDATGFLASVGLSALIHAFQRLQEAGRELVVLLSANHRLVRLLWTTALHQVVPVVSSLDDALARLSEAPAAQPAEEPQPK
ncbi:STAS domain-containing protein [Actinosynnema sp. NPDC050436]|uniref:STAS domain-containing protein n=1 Tax=Actinosynnema sp. NPDC050436 TaxID=3155659 RepID=UPI0033EBBD32